jgi:hypothetical protein
VDPAGLIAAARQDKLTTLTQMRRDFDRWDAEAKQAADNGLSDRT